MVTVNGKSLLIVRGLPGSGKSTFATSLKKYGYEHLEADQFFLDNGVYSFDATKLMKAHRWCLDTAKLLLGQGKKVVVSNTFTTLWEIEPYLTLTKSYQIICVIGNWGSIHDVPDHVLGKMVSRWIPIDGEVFINNTTVQE